MQFLENNSRLNSRQFLGADRSETDWAGIITSAGSVIDAFNKPVQVNYASPTATPSVFKTQPEREKDYATLYVVAGTVLLLGLGTLYLIKQNQQ